MFRLRGLVSKVRREKAAAPRLQRLLSVKSNCGTTRYFLLQLQAAYLCLPTTDCYLPVTPLPQTTTHLSTTCLRFVWRLRRQDCLASTTKAERLFIFPWLRHQKAKKFNSTEKRQITSEPLHHNARRRGRWRKIFQDHCDL